jgi:hypothetical protein
MRWTNTTSTNRDRNSHRLHHQLHHLLNQNNTSHSLRTLPGFRSKLERRASCRSGKAVLHMSVGHYCRFIPAILSLVLFSVCSSQGQVYPRWFLEPVGLKGTAAGYTQNYFLQSSSDSAAFLKACENLARLHFTEFQGGQAYWETEAGVYWMGDNFTEAIDTAFLENALSHGKKIAEYSGKTMTFVLVSGSDVSVPDSLKSAVRCPKKEPSWVERVPETGGYVYAQGVAPQYFYETSSWDAAEKRARFNLARNIKVTLETMQKVEDRSGQEIRNEEVSEALHDIEVVYRWRDAERGLYYVLMRVGNK